MQTHTLKRKTPNTKHVQVGRGGKRGKTAGRGTKGQNARSGHRKRPELRDLIKKIPKLRGHGKNRSKSNYAKPVAYPVNLSVLEKNFPTGGTITPAILMAKGILKNNRIPKAGVKILATGEVTQKFTVTGCAVSATAKSKIEAVGGTVA